MPSNYQQLLSPQNCALALIDFQPAMFQGVQSHDRKTIVDHVQVLARAAKLFAVADKSAITKARARLGPAPLEKLFARVARPLAEPDTPGAWYRGRRPSGAAAAAPVPAGADDRLWRS